MLKLGKLPARHDLRDIQYGDLRTDTIRVPDVFGHQKLVADWGMLGNDEYGDCAIAGPGHETMLWNAEAGRKVPFSTKNTLKDYSAITGFDPNDPMTDQGSAVADVLRYRVHTGMLDANGGRHKIGAYTSIEPGHWDHVVESTYLFGATGIGFEVPDYAMQQFQQGKPWSVLPGGQIEGGHYVPVVARVRPGYLAVVTWGAIQLMTRAFFLKYCDEAHSMISTEALKGGKSPEGFDLPKLRAELASLR